MPHGDIDISGTADPLWQNRYQFPLWGETEIIAKERQWKIQKRKVAAHYAREQQRIK